MADKKPDNQSNDSINPGFLLKRGGESSAEELAEGILAGSRTMLSQAITLIESSREDLAEKGQQILEKCLPKTGSSIRIGITGVPGVGKSTFIDALGELYVQKGKRVAVLAVDPSSTVSRGSILGDKTRMPNLSVSENAYIRPSPTSGALGGVARKTRESMLLCEAAGFDVIFVETVGVGQSETAVKQMVDIFILLMLAGAGDELQGVKRGIMEMADIISINKADGENVTASERARREYQNAVSLMPPHAARWNVPVLSCSAIEGSGLDDIIKTVTDFIELTKTNSYFTESRKKQAVHWMHESIQSELKRQFYGHQNVKKEVKNLEEAVKRGAIPSWKAARKLLNKFGGS